MIINIDLWFVLHYSIPNCAVDCVYTVCTCLLSCSVSENCVSLRERDGFLRVKKEICQQWFPMVAGNIWLNMLSFGQIYYDY